MEPDSPAQMHRSNPVTVATLLQTHPGVRAVAVIFPGKDKSGKGAVAYVVPDDEYAQRTFADTEEERKRVQRWRKAFDLSQLVRATEPPAPDFNIAGWNSSYTRQPIPTEHMREWVELTVQELRALRPREVLEIGCGTGLLLLRLAGECVRYVGADVSPAVLNKLRKQMEEMGGDWSNVTLLERAADNLEGFAEKSFDTVILNSVVKYFPSASYLIGVLEGALRLVKPGGRIFIGDVRNLALIEPYAVSIEVYQAQPATSLNDLRERVRRRILFEDQLLLSPTFFLALRARFRRITGVEVHPRRGRFDNEMTRFRYNAILNVEEEPTASLEPLFLDWVAQRFTVDSIAGLLRSTMPEMLAIKDVANARLERDLEALARLAIGEPAEAIGEFRESLARQQYEGINPQELWTLGDELGYEVAISWAASEPDGSYHVVFRRMPAKEQMRAAAIRWPQPQIDAGTCQHYASIPGRVALRDQLVKQLLDYCQQNLAKDVAPAALVMVDAIPTTEEGNIDVEKLPPPGIASS